MLLNLVFYNFINLFYLFIFLPLLCLLFVCIFPFSNSALETVLPLKLKGKKKKKKNGGLQYSEKSESLGSVREINKYSNLWKEIIIEVSSKRLLDI